MKLLRSHRVEKFRHGDVEITFHPSALVPPKAADAPKPEQNKKKPHPIYGDEDPSNFYWASAK